MPSLMFKERPYGGTSIVNDSDHIIADNGSGVDVTSQQLFNSILGNFATVQTSSIASKDYIVGERFMLNGYLYVVSEEIDSGDEIIVGTNVIKTTASPKFLIRYAGFDYEVAAGDSQTLVVDLEPLPDAPEYVPMTYHAFRLSPTNTGRVILEGLELILTELWGVAKLRASFCNIGSSTATGGLRVEILCVNSKVMDYENFPDHDAPHIDDE